MAYLIAPGVLGPSESCSGSKNTPGDLSRASDRRIFTDFLDVGQYLAYKRYINTIIGPWDLSRIVDNGLIYILTEHNEFWTDLARSGSVRLERFFIIFGCLQKKSFSRYLWGPGALGWF